MERTFWAMRFPSRSAESASVMPRKLTFMLSGAVRGEQFEVNHRPRSQPLLRPPLARLPPRLRALATRCRGAAVADGPKSFELLKTETGSVPVPKAIALRVEDIGHLHRRLGHTSGSVWQSGTWSPLPAITIGSLKAAVLLPDWSHRAISSATSWFRPAANGDQSIAATYNGRLQEGGVLITVQN